MSLRLSDVTALLDGWYDPAWAEDWDAVGLVCGDPDAARSPGAVRRRPGHRRSSTRRSTWGADLLVMPPPAAPQRGARVRRDHAQGPRRRTAWSATGCALFTAHTNADAPAGGVSESLALALGLARRRGRSSRRGRRRSTSSSCSSRSSRRRRGPRRAGRGRGRAGSATTTRRPSPRRARAGSARSTGATPAIGAVGELEVVDEARIEVGAARGRCAARSSRRCWAAHPYEEPAYDVVELADADEPDRGHGRIGRLAEPTTLRDFAARVAAVLPGDRPRRARRGRPGPAGARPVAVVRRGRRLPARHGARHATPTST